MGQIREFELLSLVIVDGSKISRLGAEDAARLTLN